MEKKETRGWRQLTLSYTMGCNCSAQKREGLRAKVTSCDLPKQWRHFSTRQRSLITEGGWFAGAKSKYGRESMKYQHKQNSAVRLNARIVSRFRMNSGSA